MLCIRIVHLIVEILILIDLLHLIVCWHSLISLIYRLVILDLIGHHVSKWTQEWSCLDLEHCLSGDRLPSCVEDWRELRMGGRHLVGQ